MGFGWCQKSAFTYAYVLSLSTSLCPFNKRHQNLITYSLRLHRLIRPSYISRWIYDIIKLCKYFRRFLLYHEDLHHQCSSFYAVFDLFFFNGFIAKMRFKLLVHNIYIIGRLQGIIILFHIKILCEWMILFFFFYCLVYSDMINVM